MAVSYNGLWKLLIDKTVSLNILEKVCEEMDRFDPKERIGLIDDAIV